MDVFDYLEADHNRLRTKLRQLIANYDSWPVPRIFDEVCLVFDEIKRHFGRQESLLSSVLDRDVNFAVIEQQCFTDRKQIRDEIDDLVMSHVDDLDFKDNLRALLHRIDAHIGFSHERLGLHLREKLPEKDLQRLNSRFEQYILQ